MKTEETTPNLVKSGIKNGENGAARGDFEIDDLCEHYKSERYLWFGLLIVYVIKLFVERYYGLKGHDKLHQVALGIMLAEFVAEAIWSTYTMTHNHQATYSVSINGRLGWDQ